MELLPDRALGVLRPRSPARFRTRMGLFFLMNNAALAVRGPLLVLLTSGLGIHYVVSNVLSLLLLTLVRFGLADTWIWAKRPVGEVDSSPYGYDVHGIVTVASAVRLPELERFRVGELIGEPDIRVRVGEVSGNGAASIHYREGPGRFGFAVAVAIGDRSRRRPRRSCAGRRSPLHQCRRADPALDLRGARLRARTRSLCGRRRARRPRHGEDRHRQDHHESPDARGAPVCVPLGRPDARDA